MSAYLEMGLGKEAFWFGGFVQGVALFWLVEASSIKEGAPPILRRGRGGMKQGGRHETGDVEPAESRKYIGNRTSVHGGAVQW